MRAIDITNKKFNKLTALYVVKHPTTYRRTWKCRCDCGNTTLASYNQLSRSRIKSCGECKSHSVQIGDIFGQLMVVELFVAVNSEGHKRKRAKVQCSCGSPIFECWLTELTRTNATRTHCGCHRYSDTLPDHLHIMQRIIDNSRQKSKRKNVSFELSNEQAFSLLTSPCHYCGSKGTLRVSSVDKRLGVKNPRQFVCNGLDRVDSSLGYVEDNVVPCCVNCNKAKNDLTVEQFKELVTNIYEYWILK